MKVSISLKSEFDPDNQFSVILGKVSISLKSELMSQRSHVPKWYILGCTVQRTDRALVYYLASRAKEITILLYYCITVLLYSCIIVLLQYCITAEMGVFLRREGDVSTLCS